VSLCFSSWKPPHFVKAFGGLFLCLEAAEQFAFAKPHHFGLFFDLPLLRDSQLDPCRFDVCPLPNGDLVRRQQFLNVAKILFPGAIELRKTEPLRPRSLELLLDLLDPVPVPFELKPRKRIAQQCDFASKLIDGCAQFCDASIGSVLRPCIAESDKQSASQHCGLF
jgi:hypothetical protein